MTNLRSLTSATANPRAAQALQARAPAGHTRPTPVRALAQPERDAMDITRDNCWEWPGRAWTSSHMREVFPTARVARGATARPLVERTAAELLTAPTRLEGAPDVQHVLEMSGAKAVLCLHRGDIVLEHYAPGFAPQDVHALLSASRCTVGLVASRLLEQGALTLDAKLGEVVPELRGSGYANATVNHVLQMRSGVASKVEPTELQAAGWKVGGTEGLQDLLISWEQTVPHGGAFAYRTGDTQALAWACEKAAGKPFAHLLSEHLWQPIGAEHDADLTLDRFGTPMASGGLCATLRDTGRLGQALLDNPLYVDWMRFTRTPHASCQKAFAASTGFFGERIEGGMFRNQFWVMQPERGVTMSYGAYGNMIWVDPENQFVGVVLSMWELPIGKHVQHWRAAFDAAGRHAEAAIAGKWLMMYM